MSWWKRSPKQSEQKPMNVFRGMVTHPIYGPRMTTVYTRGTREGPPR